MQGAIASQSAELELKYKVCEECGESLYLEQIMLGEKRMLRRLCKCERDEYNTKENIEKNKDKQARLESLIKNSLMDSTFNEKTFENWDFSKGNRKMYNLGIRYTEKFSELKAEGVGLLIHGDPGNGKTYLSCCIANRLLQNYIPVICVSVIGLLSRIKETYNKWGSEAEADILRGLGSADLLIIDDLGTETFTDWSRSTIYNIIDSRYRSKLPLIISANIQIDTSKTNGVLADLYGRRTEDRILEMCTPIKNSGASIRLEEAKRKTSFLKSLLLEGKHGED